MMTVPLAAFLGFVVGLVVAAWLAVLQRRDLRRESRAAVRRAYDQGMERALREHVAIHHDPDNREGVR